MVVMIPAALHSYTGQKRVEARGATAAAVLDDIEGRYPGMRFRVVDEQGRIRRHIRLFHDGRIINDLAEPLRADGELQIVLALSGG